VAAALILGNLPDLDYLPGLIAGAMSRWHQGAGHSIGAVALLALVSWCVARLARGRIGPPGTVAIWCLVLAGGHLLVDVMTRDTSPPVGIPLLWPFSDLRAHLPFAVFPNFDKHSLTALFTTPGNVTALGVEVALAVPAGLAAFGIGRLLSWTHR
jgi:membrane-bound metal-dependent hydrolase YbcI (DUF457 family)